MLFTELMGLVHDEHGRISVSELAKLMPGTPGEVLQDVYSDHGRNGDFQHLYGHWEVDRIVWRELQVRAAVLCTVSINPNFKRWFDAVKQRPLAGYAARKWSVIDKREDVVRHWRTYGTWKRTPVCVDESLVATQSRYHLVEGHTRLATLDGLVQVGAIKRESEHRIWLGSLHQIRQKQ